MAIFNSYVKLPESKSLCPQLKVAAFSRNEVFLCFHELFKAKWFNGGLMGFNRDLMGFIVNQWDIHGIYPLVNKQLAIENGYRNSGFSHENG